MIKSFHVNIHRDAQRVLDDIFGMSNFHTARYIDEHLCAVATLALSTEIVVGITRHGFMRRYLYSKCSEALLDFHKYVSITTHPAGKWVRCIGTFNEAYIDIRNNNARLLEN